MDQARETLYLLIYVFPELWIVPDGYSNNPEMDKVKVIGVDPLILNVIDDELDVGWNP